MWFVNRIQFKCIENWFFQLWCGPCSFSQICFRGKWHVLFCFTICTTFWQYVLFCWPYLILFDFKNHATNFALGWTFPADGVLTSSRKYKHMTVLAVILECYAVVQVWMAHVLECYAVSECCWGMYDCGSMKFMGLCNASNYNETSVQVSWVCHNNWSLP